MKSLPFGKSGKWFRGNLHTHSTGSDGRKTPAQVCSLYRRRGYDFISLTDHFLEGYGWQVTDSTPYRCDGFTTIIGAELHAPKTELGEPWHILAVGLPKNFPATGKRETGPQLAGRAARAGAYIATAHPAWYDLTDRDVLSVKSANAIEIYNTTCNQLNGKGDSVGYLDRLLSKGHRYHGIATDDAHFVSDRPDHCQNWVMVRSNRLEPESLLSALHAGRFYSSQGPEIHHVKIDRRRKKVNVRTSPIRAIQMSGRGAGAAYHIARSDVTSVQLDLNRVQGYARVTVIDKRGRRAWTNPFWL